jgi:hypothetical protein
MVQIGAGLQQVRRKNVTKGVQDLNVPVRLQHSGLLLLNGVVWTKASVNPCRLGAGNRVPSAGQVPASDNTGRIRLRLWWKDKSDAGNAKLAFANLGQTKSCLYCETERHRVAGARSSRMFLALGRTRPPRRFLHSPLLPRRAETPTTKPNSSAFRSWPARRSLGVAHK